MLPQSRHPQDRLGGNPLFVPEARSASRYCVRTATEVSPRKTPPGSVNWTNTRLTPGRSGTEALPVTKMPKVEVALAAIVVVTLIAGLARQAPLAGLVWHNASVTGRVAAPVLATAVIVASLPRLTV